jgi:hypothetical protein
MQAPLRILSFVFALALLSTPLHTQQTTIVLRVVDGDTLKLCYWCKEGKSGTDVLAQ